MGSQFGKANPVPTENAIRRTNRDTRKGQVDFGSQSVGGYSSNSERVGAGDGSIPGTTHVMAARDGLARTAVIGFDQAARRCLWCKPPVTGSVKTLPCSGGSMLRGNGAL